MQQGFALLILYATGQKPEFHADSVAALTHHVLKRLTSKNPIPSLEQYRELLPRRPVFERDQFLRSLFAQNPFLIHVLDVIATGMYCVSDAVV